MKTGCFIVLVALVAAECGAPDRPTASPPGPLASHEALAHHYTPVIVQGVASDQDYITAVDFDGD